MLRAEWIPYRLRFRFVARTSRSTMRVKDTYFIKVYDSANPEVFGVGECNLFKGLSAEDSPDYESQLSAVCRSGLDEIPSVSSIRFGVETALADLSNGGTRLIFPSPWTDGRFAIPINGLVWMGSKRLMLERIRQKIAAGFRCIKIKIGGIDFDDEIALLDFIRKHFSPEELELRLDANGAFTPDNALDRLERLAQFDIHSIEQPIKPKQYPAMELICRESPIPIALDEELIGVHTDEEKRQILSAVRPSYIILKPALCGGFDQADKWISTAQELGIGWWATSALESNIGLNAISQWVSQKDTNMPQGLGTGQLYDNNIPSPISQIGSGLIYDPAMEWGALAF